MIEIIVSSLEDLRESLSGGADRVELVTSLSQGGLTPSAALMDAILKESSLPVCVMLRPEKKGFHYTKEEIRLLRREAQLAVSFGASHVVMGALDEEGLADIGVVEEILEGTELTVTFHRAFDESADLFESLKRINGCERITHLLTSGGPGKVTDNLVTVKKILDQARPRVILGSGVHTGSLEAISNALRHFSFDLHVGTGVRDKGEFSRVQAHKVRKLIDAARQLGLR
ncbi:MAG TPA: hypothetical protein GX733_09235 [Tissierellia bacterium]|nr:hypothetical protein [Tissierellia bacterium]